MDAPENCGLGILERVWTGAVHGDLGFDVYGEMMAGCGKSNSRLIFSCSFFMFRDDIIFLHTLSFYVSEVYAESVYS